MDFLQYVPGHPAYLLQNRLFLGDEYRRESVQQLQDVFCPGATFLAAINDHPASNVLDDNATIWMLKRGDPIFFFVKTELRHLLLPGKVRNNNRK